MDKVKYFKALFYFHPEKQCANEMDMKNEMYGSKAFIDFVLF